MLRLLEKTQKFDLRCRRTKAHEYCIYNTVYVLYMKETFMCGQVKRMLKETSFSSAVVPALHHLLAD